MGHEIVYCSKCQNRLLAADFERGAAFRIDGMSICDKCAPEVRKLLPSAEKPMPRPEHRHGTTSIRIIPVPPKTARTAASKQGLGSAAWLGLGAAAAAMIVLVVLAAQGSEPTPALREGKAAQPGKSDSIAADLTELDKKLKLAAEKQEFGAALALIQEARGRHGTADWTGAIDRRSRELRDTAFRHCAALKEKALDAQRRGAEADVKALREQVGKAGVPELLQDFDRAIAAKSPKPDEPGPPKSVAAGKLPMARFVRIENPNPILSLAEVQVFSGADNVALKGTASQSSNYEGGDAAHAIDGNTDGAWQSKSVTHTLQLEVPSWWEVDLGKAAPIDRVVVWNRTDGGLQDRMKGYSVRLLDDARATVGLQTNEGYPNPSSEHSFGPRRN